MTTQQSNMAAYHAIIYAGALNSRQFEIESAIWIWDNDNSPIQLKTDHGHVPNDHHCGYRIELAGYASNPDGPYSGFNPDYQEMQWNEEQGQLTIKGENQQGQKYTCYIVFKEGR